MKVKEFLELTKNSPERDITLWVNGNCDLACENGFYHIPEILQECEIVSINLGYNSASLFIDVTGLYINHKGIEISLNGYAKLCDINWLDNHVDREYLRIYRK